MQKSWRWFGLNDKTTLTQLRQIGVEGVVTSLHHIPNGEVWSVEEISKMKRYIESHGLEWSVVESLPVSEAIKYGGADRDSLIERYITSLENLGRCGVRRVCYNFMPVIDWVRTNLDYKFEDGTSSLYFNKIDFAYFDMKILEREGAAKDYTEAECAAVARRAETISEAEREQLVDTIIVKTQGFVNGNISEGDLNPVEKFRSLLSLYDGIGTDELRENLRYFLRRVMPVCDRYDIDMAIHPDDPPFALLGLPRIVTSRDDIAWIFDAVDNKHNGLTLCAGSLSAGRHNNVVDIAREFVQRSHFVHLRSTDTLSGGDFVEASHLSGRAKLIDVVRVFERHNPDVPMRVDHGRLMLGDEGVGYNPGYSFHGRMLALGQMEGVMAVVRDEIARK